MHNTPSNFLLGMDCDSLALDIIIWCIINIFIWGKFIFTIAILLMYISIGILILLHYTARHKMAVPHDVVAVDDDGTITDIKNDIGMIIVAFEVSI